MDFIKKNSLFLSVCLLFVVAVFSFKLCSRADDRVTGQYVRLTTTWNKDTTEATAKATNISGTVRYTGCIIKTYDGTPYASNYGAVSPEASVSVTGVFIPAYVTAYADAIIYRSSAPASGSVESIRARVLN